MKSKLKNNGTSDNNNKEGYNDKNKLKKYVNGPVNVVRLEGKMFGIDKVLYVFMDVHQPVTEQTKCDDVRSKDFAQYLVDNFDDISKKDKIYDFFLEIFPTWLSPNTVSINKNIYLAEVRHLFIKSFYINREKNIISRSNTFPNIRFHYMDIRDYIFGLNPFEIDDNITFVERKGYVIPQDIEHIKKIIGQVRGDIQSVYDIFYKSDIIGGAKKPAIPKSEEELGKYTAEEMRERLVQYVSKIRGRYKHPEVQKVVNLILDQYIEPIFKKVFILMDEYDSMLNKINSYLTIRPIDLVPADPSLEFYGPSYGLPYKTQSYIIPDIITHWSTIFDTWIFLSAFLIDMYFIRRFLDKDYITNGIVYTGMLHSVAYIFTLMKYFDFKITHFHYLKESPQKLQELVKKMDNMYDLKQYIYPPIIYQCTNMSEFPPDFN